MFGVTQRMINRLVRLTVETGMITAATASLELILFLSLPNTGIHVALYVLNKLLNHHVLLLID